MLSNKRNRTGKQHLFKICENSFKSSCWDLVMTTQLAIQEFRSVKWFIEFIIKMSHLLANNGIKTCQRNLFII